MAKGRKPATVAEVRAAVEEGKRLAAERFEREFGMPLNTENAKRVIRRAAQLAAHGRRDMSAVDLKGDGQ